MTDALMPVRHSGVFKCPRCNVVAEQHWFTVRYEDREGKAEYYWGDGDYLAVNQCKNCSQMSLWMGSALIWPETTTAPSPNADMPEEVARFYAEASSVLQHSPRSAAALLRLSMQTLLRGLGLKGDLNAMIGTLVERGLPLAIQQAMDAVRLHGNEALHEPGDIVLEDDGATALALFRLVNWVVQDQITRPKDIAAVFETCPDDKRAAIAKRDHKPGLSD